MSTKRCGFTLIELLVVIAIIAILAAILFPVFAKAREKARQTSCTSNMKQISMGMLQYSQDFDERFPWCNTPPNTSCWAQNIFPYVKSMDVFKCPDNPDAARFNPNNLYNNGSGQANTTWMGQSNWLTGSQPVPVSYGMSNFVGGWNGNIPAGIPLGHANINTPASKILLTERYGDNAGMTTKACPTVKPANQDGVGWKDWDNNGITSTWSYACELIVSHTKNILIAFCDGHVKAMNPVATSGVNGAPNMWGCGFKSTTSTQYPTACNPGDINGDNPDPGMASVMQVLVDTAP